MLKIHAWQLSFSSALGCCARLLVESCSSARRLALAFDGDLVCVCHLGPFFFRLKFPALAHASRIFQLVTLPCVLLYLICDPGLTRTAYYRHKIKRTQPPPAATGYALELPAHGTKHVANLPGPQVELSPTIAERQAANAVEFERLRGWK
jgi:hypothetical protein